MQQRNYLVVVSLAAGLHIISALTGPHVCHKVVNYTVTSREQYEEPVEIVTLEWCMQIPPRCPHTRTELRQRWRMKSTVKYKSVPECCEGYVMQDLVGNAGSGEAKCIPKCDNCPKARGTCTSSNICECHPGYQGQDCSYAECPAGSWGKNCENECNCLTDAGCNPRTGECECPPGYTGPRCERKCPEGQWGVSCSSICLCEGSQASCHHETGECATATPVIDPYEASGNLVPSRSADFVIDFDTKDSIPELIDRPDEQVTAPVPSLPDDMIPVRLTTKKKIAEGSPTTTTVRFTTTTTTEGNQILQPELLDAKRQGGGEEKFEKNDFRVIVSPKTEYVKTSRKGGAGDLGEKASISVDLTAMIVVGALVGIGLTSIAAVMIFNVRSRLLKDALSIYTQDKLERQYVEKSELVGPKAGGGQLDFTIGTLSRGMTMSRPEPAVVLTTPDHQQQPVEYANGTVTIGIRLSSNIRDLLESHYDRPATVQLQRPEDHVYDEIPLAAPFYLPSTVPPVVKYT